LKRASETPLNLSQRSHFRLDSTKGKFEARALCRAGRRPTIDVPEHSHDLVERQAEILECFYEQ
jgi:hypothetical protein